MNKAQASALMNALEGQSMPATAVMAFPSGQPELWTVQLDPNHVYTGAQISALANYCATNGLTMTVQFSALGIT